MVREREREREMGPPFSLGFVFDALVLADGFTVLHGHLGLVRPHLFALPVNADVKPRLESTRSQKLLTASTFTLKYLIRVKKH